MEYAKEPALAIQKAAEADEPQTDGTGDLAISRDALLSLRQQKPLFSHTPGRRGPHKQHPQEQQSVQPHLSHPSVCSGSKYLLDNPRHWEDAAAVGTEATGGSVLQDLTNCTNGTSNSAAWTSVPKAATTVPPVNNAYGSKMSSPRVYLDLPEDPFASTPFKGTQSCLSTQPTYPFFPAAMPPPLKAPPPSKRSLPSNESSIEMPPPLKALPPSKRSLPFSGIPAGDPPVNTPPHAFAASPMFTTPCGVFLNPAFKANPDPSTVPAGYQPYANFQIGSASVPLPVHASIPRPPQLQAQTSFPHHHGQASLPFRHPPLAHLPYSSYGFTQAHAEAYMHHKPAPHPMAASHPHHDGTARRASTMAMLPSVRAPHCVSLDKQGVHADQPKTKSTDKPAETAAFSAGRDKKEHTALFQAERLSSWCHVKHSRGQTPELSRDQVKALVQAQIEAGKPMRTAWYRGSEHVQSCRPASTGSAVNVPFEAFLRPTTTLDGNVSATHDAPWGSTGQTCSTGVFQPFNS